MVTLQPKKKSLSESFKRNIIRLKKVTNSLNFSALDKNEYNHITATYFLLAERKLRAQRQEQAQKKRPDLSLPVSISR